MGVPPSGTAGNAHELRPQPAPSGSGSAGKALKGEKLHFYFHFISEASSGVSQALEGILKGGGGFTKKSFFFPSQSPGQAAMTPSVASEHRDSPFFVP